MEKKKHVEYKILSGLLSLAADEFSSRGCNDYELANTQENIDLLELVHNWDVNGDKNQPFELSISKDGKKLYTQDYLLMRYFAHILLEKE